ncbi:MAG: restriction endonuclease subunit S [Antarcticimicrobium sp.]|uniref:restriction endonuclease subunit S n=1 Tax=Antarcticimicrobium sp. TaxID=2824147 RepID=UPI002622BEAD|nr:restriction endonuclease subunit S [Antarcticimicrobium sp.]MDF1718061.1 restriction endonuclease subunit S [Antarcticimicrobium sp.]
MSMVPLGEIAKPISNNRGEANGPVLSITKHEGFVRSADYFKKVVHSKDLSKYKRVEKGNFAFSPIHLDEGSIALADEEGLISPMYRVFEAQEDRVDKNYLIRILKADPMVELYGTLGDGSVHRRRSVPWERLSKVEIPLPPLEEQKRIAGILDQADALRRLRTRALDKLNTLGQAIFHEMFGDPADNPKDFPRKKLLDIVKIIGGSQPAKKHFLYEDGPGRVRFIQTRDFRTDVYKTYVPEGLAKRPFTEDDVIIGRYGPPVFQIFRGLAGTYNVALMKAEPIGEITKDFVYYLLQEPKLHGYVVANSERTAGQSGVNLDLLREYPVYAPPIQIQESFTERLQEIEKLAGNTRQQCSSSHALFAALQHRAFRGEL